MVSGKFGWFEGGVKWFEGGLEWLVWLFEGCLSEEDLGGSREVCNCLRKIWNGLMEVDLF